MDRAPHKPLRGLQPRWQVVRAAPAPVASRRRRSRAAPVAAGLWDAFTKGGGGGENDKVVHLLRHGESQMNVHLGLCRGDAAYGGADFIDPLLFDTRLTPRGQRQAADAAPKARALAQRPQLVVVSPLTRALQTAEEVWGHLPPLVAAAAAQADGAAAAATSGGGEPVQMSVQQGGQGRLLGQAAEAEAEAEAGALGGVPRLAHPLAAERLYLSSDVGRVRMLLERDWGRKGYDFSRLPPGRGAGAGWWHPGPGAVADLMHVVEEPEDVFLRRVEAFRRWLAARPEACIAVVSHHGVLRALTGDDYDNCELRSVRLGQLRARPHLMPAPGQGEEAGGGKRPEPAPAGAARAG